MAGWETQGFERGWGGTGRTFLSHYKRLEPLGEHPPGPPARSPWPAALLLPQMLRHPGPPPWMERDEVPANRQPEPQMLRLESVCAGGRVTLPCGHPGHPGHPCRDAGGKGERAAAG